MRNDEDTAAGLLIHIFKHADEILKTPQINAGFRFVKDRKTGAARKNTGNLNPFEFAARKRGVDLPVDIFLGAKTDFGKVGAGRRDRQFFSRRQRNQIFDGDSLEADRLLESETDAQPRAFCN